MEESIHVIFDEHDDGILSKGFADLKLCHDDYDEDEATKEKGTNMQEQIQALDEANLVTNKGSQGPNKIIQELEPREQV